MLDLTQFVDKYYEMDPATEALLPNGRSLKPGMCVLIDRHSARADVAKLKEPERSNYNEIFYLARERNRWCLVAEVEIIEDYVHFTATYDDGVSRRRSVPLVAGWLVKLAGLKDDELIFKPVSTRISDSFLERIQNEMNWVTSFKKKREQKDEGRYLTPDPIPEPHNRFQGLGLILEPILDEIDWTEQLDERIKIGPNYQKEPHWFIPPRPKYHVNPHLHYPATFTDFDPDSDG